MIKVSFFNRYDLAGCTIGDMQATGDSSPQKKASRQNAAKKLWEKKDDILAKKSEFDAMAAQNTKVLKDTYGTKTDYRHTNTRHDKFYT